MLVCLFRLLLIVAPMDNIRARDPLHAPTACGAQALYCIYQQFTGRKEELGAGGKRNIMVYHSICSGHILAQPREDPSYLN